MIVDSSAALSWAFADEENPTSQALFVRAAQEQVHVPAIWPFEVANKLSQGLRKGRLTPAELREVLGTFEFLDIHIHEPASLPSLVDIAQRTGLTAYAAAFVQLALREGQALATFDKKMRAAALAAGVVVIP